jgi:hypothetical protein
VQFCYDALYDRQSQPSPQQRPVGSGLGHGLGQSPHPYKAVQRNPLGSTQPPAPHKSPKNGPGPGAGAPSQIPPVQMASPYGRVLGSSSSATLVMPSSATNPAPYPRSVNVLLCSVPFFSHPRCFRRRFHQFKDVFFGTFVAFKVFHIHSGTRVAGLVQQI